MSMVRYMQLIKLYKPEKNKRIIDCASGVGNGIRVIQDNLTPTKLVEVDIDENALAFAKKIKRGKTECKVKCVIGDITCLSYFEEFDYFFCVETLEHIHDFELIKAVPSIIKSIAVGGSLFITVPGNEKTCWESKKHKQFLSPTKLINLFINYFDRFNGHIFTKNLFKPQAISTIIEFKGKKKC